MRAGRTVTRTANRQSWRRQYNVDVSNPHMSHMMVRAPPVIGSFTVIFRSMSTEAIRWWLMVIPMPVVGGNIVTLRLCANAVRPVLWYGQVTEGAGKHNTPRTQWAIWLESHVLQGHALATGFL
jgi:hypothetical protein